MACFNLAVAALMMDDPVSMFKELAELEIYLTPDMNVYKNLIATGLDQLIFRNNLLPTIQLIEDVVYSAIHGKQKIDLSEGQTASILRLLDILKSSLIKIDKVASTDAPYDIRDDRFFNRPQIIIKKLELHRASVQQDNESEVESPSYSRRDSTSRNFFTEDNPPPSEPRRLAKDHSESPSRPPANRSPRSFYKSLIFAKGNGVQALDLRAVTDRFVDLV